MDFLVRENFNVGRLHVATLMKRMGIEAIYRRRDYQKSCARGGLNLMRF
jgi:putative transposase